VGKKPHGPEEKRIKAQIGESLSRLVSIVGISQTEFARSIGISQPLLSQLCRGEKMLDQAVAVRIRAKYHVTLDYLYCGDQGTISEIALAEQLRRSPRG
jgi:transcriptional regulator with XRE-family HTH domain